ncbi:MAG: sigma-54-dependent Fis family transcriptional regulator [Acidobacteriota bacterium]|nr:MAG: sigma-54-dependent Fis family transcriptional regulator [Acidobacteriota bacterium]
MPEKAQKILIVDDEPAMQEWLAIFLRKEGHHPVSAETADSACRALERDAYTIALCDVRLPDGNGLDVLRHGRNASPETIFVMMTAYSSTEDAVEAMKLGASDYLIKPFDLDEFRLRLDAALERRLLREENVYLRKTLAMETSLENIVAVSGKMRDVLDLARRVAPTDSTVLLEGESGTGKELVARALHKLSPRSPHTFVSINCGALPETLLESELFGHLKGSFTGAVENKKGLFEVAHRGTIFLDEISEMSPAMQVKLLRALQERTVRRIGSEEETEVDLRVIAATNKVMQTLVEEGMFREDLYYRINVIAVHIPPLRERREDILPLARSFLKEFCGSAGKKLRDFSGETKVLLERYPWPGNVRELKNAVERAVALESTDVVLPESLPDALRGEGWHLPSEDEITLPEGFKLEEHSEEVWRRYLRAALRRSGGVKTKAAEMLGMSLRSFRYHAKRLGVG